MEDCWGQMSLRLVSEEENGEEWAGLYMFLLDG